MNISHQLLITLLTLGSHLSSAKLALRLSADSQCPMPGYFRDETDCRKFYRCAEHATQVPGQNVISKVEFNCPQGTIYDETLSSCNHISFVRDVPPGCNTMNPVVGGGGSSMVDNHNSAASSSMPSTTPANNPPPSSGNEPMSPPSSNPGNMPPPLHPLVPPSNFPPLPVIPGDQQNSMMPPSGIPELPIFPGGNPMEQPPLPVIPGAPGNQEQQPAVPIPVLPPSNQEMSPSFPAFPGFPPSGVGASGQFPQTMPPAAISVPVMQGGQHQQLQFPSINIPNNQYMQNTFPFNFNMFSQHPSISVQNIPGISPGAVSENQLQLQSQSQQTKPLIPLNQQNNAHQQQNSQIAIAIPVENQNAEISATWVNRQNFLNMQHSSPSNIINNDNNKNSQANPNWVVPNNFPTFYTVLGGKTPVLLAGQQVSGPTAYVIV